MALTAGLPNLSDPSIVAFGAAIGAFFTSTKARRRHDDPEQWARSAIEGSYYGTAIGLVIYLFANVLKVSIL